MSKPAPKSAPTSSIKRLQRKMFENYARSVGLDPDAAYLDGTPLRPVVPLDTATGGVFVLGAYPSARFMVVERPGKPVLNNVPCADNLGPFEEERWFDGRRVRVQPSATELRDLFLDPMGITREKCWVTDLVKVFLFKDGHARAYRDLGATPPKGYERERFDEIGKASLDEWIGQELAIAQPKLVITLGAEVAGIVRGVKSAAARTKLLQARVEDVAFGDSTWPTVHCAHPGILMRGENRWTAVHRGEFVSVLRGAVRVIGRG